MSYQLTKKEALAELIKCGKEPEYFINNFAQISHPMRGLIPFRLYPFQKEIISDFNDHRFNIILKARQLGISTTVAAYVAWLMLFHRDKNVLVIATKLITAANLVRKVKHLIKNLPQWMKISSIVVDNRNSFELENASQIKASSTSGDAGRSEALTLLVVDEAAFVEGLDELWTGLYPTLSTGGRCIALSTPNGVGNWFHKAFMSAEAGTNDFKPTVLRWDEHPDRDQDWYDQETKNMSRRQIAQELECNFNMSGETVFHPEDINELENLICEPKYKTGFDRNLWIWEEFQPGNSYIISADVARGDGKDYSAFHVIKLETMEVIAEYQGKLPPDDFSDILVSTGREYGNCMIIVENNSVGYAVLDKLTDKHQYENVYHSVKSTHEYVEQYVAEQIKGTVAGFSTTSKTRPLIISKMEEYVRNKLIKVYSSRLLAEIKTFVWNYGRPEAMTGYNDDLVMACAIGCWVRDTALVINQKDLEYKKASLNAMIMSNTKLNTTIPGQHGYDRDASLEKTFKGTDGRIHDFGWLLKG
jgi:hypothetical protein